MKKGFTLIELIAVIALIGIFLLVVIPTVDTVLNKQRDKLYNMQVSKIKDALKTWGNINIDSLPSDDGDFINVTLLSLKNEGLIEDDIKNPKTDKCYSNNNTFIIKKSKETYMYIVEQLNDGVSSDCNIGT